MVVFFIYIVCIRPKIFVPLQRKVLHVSLLQRHVNWEIIMQVILFY